MARSLDRRHVVERRAVSGCSLSQPWMGGINTRLSDSGNGWDSCREDHLSEAGEPLTALRTRQGPNWTASGFLTAVPLRRRALRQSETHR